jgi:hypothetical protein
MKRVIPFLLLGAATATRLGSSNVGVEEIGDQIEFFPKELPTREELLTRRLIEGDIEVRFLCGACLMTSILLMVLTTSFV